jgi:alpha 1,3-mannosyltransferase
MINFTPRREPLKEGRSHHGGLPYAGHSGRGLRSRQSTFLIVGLICIGALFYFLNGGVSNAPSSSQERLSQLLDRSRSGDAKVVLSGDQDDHHPGHQHPSIPESSSGEQVKPFVAPPVEEAPTKADPKVVSVAADASEEKAVYQDDISGRPKGYDATKSSPKSSSTSWSERPRFEKALSEVVNMLPGEMQMRDLLRPVDGTGKEKLREMGLRVRSYKRHFEAWEALHLDTDAEGGTYIRDDVIQYLRSHEHKAEGIDGMTEMSLAQQIRSYEAYRYFIAKFGQLLFPWTAPYFSDHMSLHAHFKRGGKGIVLTAGDDQAPYLLTSIPIMRKMGCKLPIEVMYLGDNDLSEDFRADLEAIDGVVTRDIAQMVNDEGWRLAGWAAKPFAILLSSFREVIFIDADSLFFRNPEVLFEEPGYKNTGALFFRDRLIMPENKKRWLQQILPKPISKQVKQSRFWTGDSGHMQESGVVVVDKYRHYLALQMVTRMNGPDRDGNKDEGRVGVYDMVYGDKETFWIGWELVGDLDYTFHAGDAGIMGMVQQPEEEHKQEEKPRRRRKKPRPEGEGPPPEGQPEEEEWEEIEEPEPDEHAPDHYTICAPQLLHLDTSGKPLWFNGWLLSNKFADKKQKRFGRFDHYLIEPRDVRDPGAWQLHENNECCLTTDPDKKFDFSDSERQLLAEMMAQAKEVGAPGSDMPPQT